MHRKPYHVRTHYTRKRCYNQSHPLKSSLRTQWDINSNAINFVVKSNLQPKNVTESTCTHAQAHGDMTTCPRCVRTDQQIAPKVIIKLDQILFIHVLCWTWTACICVAWTVTAKSQHKVMSTNLAFFDVVAIFFNGSCIVSLQRFGIRAHSAVTRMAAMAHWPQPSQPHYFQLL